ncbi:Trehalose-6-phosphate hydrolase [Halanaerobium saccharolyticum subsp. saccharolyticum DSM 6643]|uniref:Trehalose-6-phosphate hydrolase n=1 Tax=Halanaerobium saccharolyticum subsp. saccharolyticum DSM 6643 TaxID=1293054 RepID=M5E365_9FIRM|nr:alpha-glucosidase [Halanaerobium saccharolyticum]CCU80117.1 Trehalose-6-phosphate hydrolase [Halanaerobium saccharolyticum subsp. saccharolyticum DSM 6643]
MNRKWWKEAVVYQIYPRSFNDSNDDGIGDLRGIIEKIDYIEDLGVDVIWLTPINESPNYDNGYDISDYKKIMKEFGTLNDFKSLLKEAKKRDIKIIIDLVMNHTSHKHIWFQNSKKELNKKNDYYIWKKQKPNNWKSFFSGPAWEYDEERDEYYLHLYSKEQPDLNWENEDVKNEFKKIINWWIDLGVSGFRLDAIHHLGKSQEFTDININDFDDESQLFAAPEYTHRKKVHELLNEFNEELFTPNNLMTVGEIGYADLDTAYNYTCEENKEVNMVVQFDHLKLPDFKGHNLDNFKKIQQNWYDKLFKNAWIAQYLENHDQPRSITKYGDANFRRESGTLLATMLLTLPGTPFIYQGQEIGMTNVDFDSIEDYDDIKTINKYWDLIETGYSEEDFFQKLKYKSRDNARTPMQWTAEKYAGFSNTKPWLKINPNYKKINVKSAQNDENSILETYKKLINLRKKYSNCLVYGSYKEISSGNNKYIYLRKSKTTKMKIILNFSDSEIELDQNISEDYKLVFNNYNNQVDHLCPYEAQILIKKI